MSPPQTGFYPPEHSLLATTIEIKDQYYDEVVDLGKLFPPIAKSKKQQFLESLPPQRVYSMKKSFLTKSERDRCGNNSCGQRQTQRQGLLMPRLCSPASERDRRIRRKLKRANATMQTTLIPIERLRQYSQPA
jgi:hypothetical protein